MFQKQKEKVHLGSIWQVGAGGEEGVLGVEDPRLTHVPDLEACYQPGHQHPAFTPHLYQVPRPCTNTPITLMAGVIKSTASVPDLEAYYQPRY